MADSRPYDLIIFGATGFTGQFVVDEVVRVAEEEGSLTWAIAGRSMEKLQKVLEESSQRTGKNVEEKPIVVADSSSYNSLLEMAKQTRVVLNCVGPYRFHGEQVVKACIEGGASHVDISGEPQYLEKMQLLYNAKAREAGVYIIGACGFDSIPADMGILFTRNKFQGDLNAVEGFLNLSPGPDGLVLNYATFESAVYGFADSGELQPLRKALFPNPLPRSAHRPPKRPTLFHSKETDKWCLPFPGSDKSVVQRSQRFAFDEKKQRPVQFIPYFCRPSRFAAYAMAFFAVIFGLMAKFGPTRSLLLMFPSFFTAGVFKKGGPTMAQIKGTSFSWTFLASGYSQKLQDHEAQHEEEPDKKMVTKVSGPEPGYVTTPICMVQAGLVIVKEKSRLPKEGGVYTPAAAFEDTSLIQRLDKHNIKFQQLEE
ncbi:saccharopine dehydrogenase-like oxidoreductase isoform X2 [Littorina saxatilis]|uniref:Saccharopine dehydrogenase NADP binding domain-containing protein n=1 Tax=Littorina saxatilis TaxID=31220 RepID=A0AAN9BEK3_9CAEN